MNAVGATDNPYGWFGVNNAKTWEVYRKFTQANHPNPSPTPDPALEPRISNPAVNQVQAIVHNQTAGQAMWWNGSGLWFGPAGNATPADYQLLISHPYTVNGANERVPWSGPMDIRVGFVEAPKAGGMVNQDGGDGRVGNYSVADFYEGPVGADVVQMTLALGPPSVDTGGTLTRRGALPALRSSTHSDDQATALNVTQTGTTGKGPYAVSSRIFRDPDFGTTKMELKFGGWNGTIEVLSLTDDAGGTNGSMPFERPRFDFDPADPSKLRPVTYLNTAGTTTEPQQMDTYMTIRGDATLDGRVDGSDFALLAGNFGKTERGWVQGDFTQDGRVDGTDFALLAGNFGKRVPGVGPGVITASDWAALESYGQSIGVAVPEPTSLSVLAAALGLLARDAAGVRGFAPSGERGGAIAAVVSPRLLARSGSNG